jgi:hypothetical protein
MDYRMWFSALLVFALCLSSPFASAQGEGIPMAYDLNVRESIISVSGKRYRKVEYRGDTYYLRLLESEKDAGSLELECNKEPSGLNMENQVLVSTSMTKRSSLFIDGLKQTCAEIRGGKKKVVIDPNVRVGFTLDGTKDDLLQNKKIFVTPLKPGLGFSGEW